MPLFGNGKTNEEKFVELVKEAETVAVQDPRKAIKLLEQANKQVESALTYHMIGNCYSQLNKPKDALKAYEAATQFALADYRRIISVKYGLLSADAVTETYLGRGDHNKVLQGANNATQLIQHILDYGWEELFPQARITIRKQTEFQAASFYTKKQWEMALTYYYLAQEKYGAVSSIIPQRIAEIEKRLNKKGIDLYQVANIGINFAALFK